MPARLRNMGPSYLRWRAEEITRGPLGPGGNGVPAAHQDQPQAQAA
jgi:hypothetical protein